MKKYQVTWGCEPPQYDRPKGNFRLFFHEEEVTREVSHEDPETGEVTSETIKEWLCDVVEYDRQESEEAVLLLKKGRNSPEFQKWMLMARIAAYDKSRHVEDFTIGGIHLWLDSSLRTKVKENLETCEKMGRYNATLRFNGMAFPVSVQMGWQMYFAVLDYARACWNVTERHLAAAEQLETVEEIKAYDYKQGYPEKLVF